MGFATIQSTAEERARTFPGDDLLREAVGTWTHAVTIAAPPRTVYGVPNEGGGLRGTWEVLLDPLPGDRTRLLVRARVGPFGRKMSLRDVTRPIDLVWRDAAGHRSTRAHAARLGCHGSNG